MSKFYTKKLPECAGHSGSLCKGIEGINIFLPLPLPTRRDDAM